MEWMDEVLRNDERKRQEESRAKEADEFQDMCLYATDGRLNPSLFPKEYEYLSQFENAFCDVARKFNSEKRRLRARYLGEGYSPNSAQTKIIIRLLSKVMDECERRGFPWPSSLLRIKSDLTRELNDEAE